MSTITNDALELKLERLVSREISMKDKIKHSASHVDSFAGKSGILLEYSMPEVDYEEAIALIEFVMTVVGKKSEFNRKMEIWVNVKDISGI